MNSELIQIMLNSLETKCPFCPKSFRCKMNMRFHLKKHTNSEAKSYILKAVEDL